MGLHAMSLSRRPDAPRVCVVPTASADEPRLVAEAVLRWLLSVPSPAC